MMMKYQLALFFTFLAFIGDHSDAAETPRPNILFILADDLGQRDLGCYGSTFYETPNLDQLAKDGALFTDAYAACPVCSPTRASIISGKWPQRTGITDYIGAPTTPELWKRNTKSLPAAYTDRLSLESPTMAKALKAAGYSTFFAGKWHLGPEGWWPENQGFDVNMGGTDRGGPYGGNKYFSPYGNPRLPDGPDGEHLPDVRWPEIVMAGSVINTHISSPDFFPTLLEATNAKPQPNQTLDGMNLMPVFKGGTLPERALFWHYPHYGNQGGAPSAAIRRGDWKLIQWLEGGHTELFNLAQDPGEQTNLATEEPQRLAQLRGDLQLWQEQVGAKFPIDNPNYDPNKPNGREAKRPIAQAGKK